MNRALVALALAASAAAAGAQGPLPVNVGGRVIAESGGAMRFGWPGTYFEGRFRGTSVRIRFEAPADHLRLLVDGEEKALFQRPGLVDFTVGGLVPGEHLVRLEKMSESQTGGGRFLGFSAGGGGTALPAPRRARQIEFVGDSYTVGYGNRSPRRECTAREVHDSTDTQQAYGPLVARHFDADYRIHAYSGFGVVRNYGGRERGLSLPAIYDRLKPDASAAVERPDPRWRPQLIVVNLGTNDFSTPLQTGEPWSSPESLRTAFRSAYAAFVTRLAARQPQASFVLMAGDTFAAHVAHVAASLPAPLRSRIVTVRFGQLELSACDWHPSLEDHRRLAAQLLPMIAGMDLTWPLGTRRN